MQNELLFITDPAINPKGFNQFVKILAIQEKTFQHRSFKSMSECNKALKADIREISRISLGKLYTCSKGWTFIRVNNDTNLEEEIKCFQKIRSALNTSILPNSKVCCKSWNRKAI